MTASKYTKKGNAKFKSGEYDFAVQLYQSALSKGGQKDFLNFKIGESYRLSNRLVEAVPFYEKALENNVKLDTAAYYYAIGLKSQGNYEQSLKRLKDYSENGRTYDFRNKALLEINNLKQWEEIYSRPTGFKIKNADYLNTKGAEFCAYKFDENSLIFSTSRGQSKLYRANGLGFLDLYKYRFDGYDATSGQAKPLEPPIYSEDMHEACVTYSPDGNTMIFARSNDGSKKGRKETDLYISYYRNAVWTEPSLMKINVDGFWTSTPMLSPDGQTLYFSSNRRGGNGGIDLYKATLENDTAWANVTNLGSKINTAGNELYPFLTPSGKFYFSSDGHPGLGSLDLFVAKRDSSTGALSINNLGRPANSTSDDFGIYFSTDSTGYLSSNREGGKGDDDIYEFTYKPLYIINFFLDGVAKQLSKDSSEIELTNVRFKLYDGNDLQLDSASEGGRISKLIKGEKQYLLTAEKKGFFTKEYMITTKGKTPPIKELKEGINHIRLFAKVVLEKIELNKEIVLENIYYDYNKTEIRTDAATELDKLVRLLIENPGIKIELGSHTDSRGNNDFNLKLSQGRAEAAVNYIISKGIDSNRLVAKGYGETKPIVVEQKTEEDFQRNRRTEFKVLEILE